MCVCVCVCVCYCLQILKFLPPVLLCLCFPYPQAVAWCPWQPNVLATGGGTNDKCIKFWNVSTGQCTDSINTKSQVCTCVRVTVCLSEHFLNHWELQIENKPFFPSFFLI